MASNLSGNRKTAIRAIFVAILTASILIAGSAYGGIVSGIVRINSVPIAGKTLVFIDRTRGTNLQAASDRNGQYTVLLPPGAFVLQIDGRVCGSIQSSSQPLQNDVEIRSCR